MDVLFGLSASVPTVLWILLICCIIEHIGIIERFSLGARIPGVLMNLAQVYLGIALIVPVAQLWNFLGLGTVMRIPLWSWLSPLGLVGYALQWLTLVVVADFLAYWRHRAEHKWFWQIHAVHHSPTELHAANDIGHPVQIWFSLLFITIPGSLIEFEGPGTPKSVAFFVALLSYYIHSPVRLNFGPLRKLLVDNRFHRIHHSLEERHFDKNFGICFSIWDRLFGTAYDPAPDEWPSVGVAGLEPPRSLTDFLSMPVRVGRVSASEAAPADELPDPTWVNSASSSRAS